MCLWHWKEGLRIILTSAVLRTVENSRIKACAHWENANWLNCCTPHLLFSLLLASCPDTPERNIGLSSPTEWKLERGRFPAGAQCISGASESPTAGHTVANGGWRFDHLCVQIPATKGTAFLLHSTLEGRAKVRCVTSTRCESGL